MLFDAFAYATGDIVIGTNPVDSTVASVAAVENALKDVVDTFGLQDTIPWCALSHIDAPQPSPTAPIHCDRKPKHRPARASGNPSIPPASARIAQKSRRATWLRRRIRARLRGGYACG